MRRVVILALACVTAVGCNRAAPDPGQEAVIVRKPWIFGHGGLAGTPVKTGLSWFAPSTQVWYVVMQPQQYSVHFEDLMSREGVPLDFDAVLRLQVTDSVKLVDKFGVWTVGNTGLPAWYHANVQKPFETMVRQAVRKHGMNETAISTTAIEDIDAEVSKALRAHLDAIGLPVTLVDVTVGRANPPDAVKHQRIETASQEQRANTERQRKLAEDQRREAELARAAADNAYREAMRMTPEQFLALEAIKMQREVCAKGGCTFLLGASAFPAVNVR